MKFLSLHIKNIASVEEARIDFTTSPLAGAHLFLISGPTGAGKSTILDAIALALYATAPRLRGCRSIRVDEAAVDDEGRTLIVLNGDNPLNLVRKGASESYVRLVFEGNDGHCYLAEFNVSFYRKGKKKGCLNDSKNTLFSYDLDSGAPVKALTNTQTDFHHAVRSSEVVGQDFDRFCRTTMLAQGAFDAFLTAGKDSKSSILEDITGIDRFSVYGARIKALYQKKKEEYQLAQSKFDGISLLDDDILQGFRTELLNLEAEKSVLQSLLNTLNGLRDWIIRRDDVKKKSQSAEAEHEALCALKESYEFRLLEHRLELYDLYSGLRGAEERLKVAEARIAECVKEHESLSYEIFETGNILRYAESMEAACTREIGTVASTLETRISDFFPIVDNHESLIAMCDSYSRIYSEYNSFIEATRSSEVERKTLHDSMTGLQVQTQELTESLCGIDKEIMKSASLMEAFMPDELSATLSDIKVSRKIIADIRNNLSSLNEEVISLENEKNSLAAAEAAIPKLEETVRELQTSISVKDTLMDALTAERDRLKLALGDAVTRLRHEMHPGDRCPVCDSLITRIIPDEVFESALRPVEESLAKTERERNVLKQNCEETSGKLIGLRAEVLALQKGVSSKKIAIKRYSDWITQELPTLNHPAVRAYLNSTLQDSEDRRTLDADLVQILEEKDRQYTEVSRKINEFKTLKESIAKLNGRRSAVSEGLNFLSKEKGEVEKSLLKLDQQIGTLQNKVSETKGRLLNLLNALSAYRYPCGVYVPLDVIDPKDWLAPLRDTIEKVNRLAHSLRRKLEHLTEKKSGFAVAVRSLNDFYIRLRALIPEAEDARADGERKTAEPVDSLEWLTSQVGRTSDLLSRCSRHAGKLQNLKDDYKACLAEREKERDKAYEAVKSGGYDVWANDGLMSRSDAGFSDEELMAARDYKKEIDDKVLISKATLDRLLAEYRAINEAIPAVPEGLGGISVSSESAAATIMEKLESTKMMSEKACSRIAAINEHLRADNLRRSELVKEKERLDALKHCFELMEIAYKEFGGDRFKDIAASYILSCLLEKGNGYLEYFSPRYKMYAVSGSLDVMVHDSEAGERRPYNTLSGGETFMISLALALGLSAMQNAATTCDTIFIDEGFGTLSSDYLETVMETLEKLQRLERRRIGVISHIESLKERIPVKIQVTPRGPSMSRVTVSDTL